LVRQGDLGVLTVMLRASSPSPFLRALSVVGLCLFCLSAVGPPGLWAQQTVNEAQLKAAFIKNFLQYVEWPSTSQRDENLILCTLGEADIHEALVSLSRARLIDGRPIQPAYHPNPEGVEFCHLLFVSRSEERSFEEVLERLEGRSVLTVSDMDGFAESGGMIGFLVEGTNLTFEINVDNAREAEIEIRSRLLGAAHRVIGVTGSGRRSKRRGPTPAKLPDRYRGGGS